jgi:AcrR family transcriptional regulator
LSSGRTNQKQRTRRELLEATCRLIARGISPSLEAVSAEAKVSRATVYRYFPSMDTLLLESPLDEKTATPEVILAEVSTDERASAADRVVQVQRYLFDLVADNETHFRLYLRSLMEQWLKSGGKLKGPLRGARRVPMLEKALDPVRGQMDKKAFKRLVHALSMLVSIEPFIAATDVCRLNRKEGREVLSWAVHTLTEAALRDQGNRKGPESRKPRRRHRGSKVQSVQIPIEVDPVSWTAGMVR